jgi:two-component system sensor histidine kinase QseC
VGSLRARLLLTVSLVSVVVWAVAVWVSYEKALHEADELLDGQLVQATELLRAQIRHEDDLWGKTAPNSEDNDKHDDDAVGHWATEALHYDASLPYSQNLTFVISDSQGIRLRSANAPNIPTTLKQGITNIDLPNEHWRVLTVLHAPDLRIQAAHLRDTREKAALEVAQQVALPPLFALPLLIGLVYLAVRRGLQPLNVLADTVANRSADHLDPIVQPNTPNEARPLLNAINQLLARIDTAMARERRFTADAAHELRTPIAALKIHAQIAAASPDANDRNHALAQMLQGIQRAERLIEQMLRLARLDPAVGLSNRTAIDLELLLQETFETSEGMAQESGHTLAIDPVATLPPLQGDADLLRTALINLTHNACRHTPSGCGIRLCAEAQDGEIRLSVRDDGPGVEADELDQLGTRFRRGKHASTAGSGLGLAIVRRIAELHGAHLRLANLSPRGFEAALHWKQASS